MFRSSTDGNASFVDLVYTNNRGVQLLYRDGTGASANQAGGNVSVPAGPVYLKLVRSGSIYTGLYSTNGINWTTVASDTNNSVGTSALCGLVACSADNGRLVQVTYSNVAISQTTVVALASARPTSVNGTSTNPSVPGANLPGAGGQRIVTSGRDPSAVPGGPAAPSPSTGGINPTRGTAVATAWRGNLRVASSLRGLAPWGDPTSGPGSD